MTTSTKNEILTTAIAAVRVQFHGIDDVIGGRNRKRRYAHASTPPRNATRRLTPTLQPPGRPDVVVVVVTAQEHDIPSAGFHHRRDAALPVGPGGERPDDERRLASAAAVADVRRRNVALVDALDAESHGDARRVPAGARARARAAAGRPHGGRQQDRVGGDGARRRVVEVGAASPRR